jgi:hypothetical protein
LQVRSSLPKRSLAWLLRAGVMAAVCLPAALAHAEEPVPAPESVTPEVVIEQAQRPVTSVHMLIREGKLREALHAVEILIAHDPKDDELKTVHARLLYWLGHARQAEAEAQDLHQRHPTDLEVTELLAQIRLAQGDSAGALRLYKELEAAGDRRPEILQRIIDLHLQHGDAKAVRAALAHGGKLSEEQELDLAKLEHPWFADAGSATTVHNQQTWPRLEGDIGYRFSQQFAVLAGVAGESRGEGVTLERAFAPKVEAYFGKGRLSGMAHLDSSPSRTFLPLVDARLDLQHQTTDLLGLGLYLRLAHYHGLDKDGTEHAPVDAFSVAPSLSFTVRSFVLQPGYMFVVNHTSAATAAFGVAQPASTGLYNTGFLKIRWQASAPTAVFFWTFLGQDPSFLERNLTANLSQSAGLSVLLGVDHWWNGRFGTRVSVGRVQPLGNIDPFTEFALVLRGRL